MKIKELIEVFENNKIEENIIPMENYMKNKFKFLGIKSVKRRELSKEFLRKNKNNLDWDLVFELWDLEKREYQYVACDYLKERKKLLEYKDLENLKKLITRKSWWDTVDNLSPLVGEAIRNHENKNELMLNWSTDENFWIRRASILHQLKFKIDTDTNLLDKIIKNNLGSNEFFINKAIGWILREYSKTNPKWVRDYINNNKDKLNSLSIREGMKRLIS